MGTETVLPKNKIFFFNNNFTHKMFNKIKPLSGLNRKHIHRISIIKMSQLKGQITRYLLIKSQFNHV